MIYTKFHNITLGYRIPGINEQHCNFALRSRNAVSDICQPSNLLPLKLELTSITAHTPHPSCLIVCKDTWRLASDLF